MLRPGIGRDPNAVKVFRYRLLLAYDGAGYAGWQVQPGRPTIQGVIEDALARIDGAPVKLHGSGRTDQGVHAAGQVAHVDLANRWMPFDLVRALNANLPQDIRVFRAAAAAPGFHARRDAVAKEYRYRIWNGPVLPPELRLYRAFCVRPLDVAAMNKAAAMLLGKHDFAAFTANPNREVLSTTRNLMRLCVGRRGRDFTIAARADGFLFRMVRSLAGFLIRVGEGELQPESACELLAARVRTAVVPTAPPQGLVLWRVWY